MQKVLSSQSRLDQIVADILMDMETRDRLKSGRGNALLISGSIYQASKFYELFDKTDLRGKCAIVTSYKPSCADLKGEESGEGANREAAAIRHLQEDAGPTGSTKHLRRRLNRVEEFDKAAKKKFIDETGAV